MRGNYISIKQGTKNATGGHKWSLRLFYQLNEDIMIQKSRRVLSEIEEIPPLTPSYYKPATNLRHGQDLDFVLFCWCRGSPVASPGSSKNQVEKNGMIFRTNNFQVLSDFPSKHCSTFWNVWKHGHFWYTKRPYAAHSANARFANSPKVVSIKVFTFFFSIFAKHTQTVWQKNDHVVTRAHIELPWTANKMLLIFDCKRHKPISVCPNSEYRLHSFL